MGAPQQFIAVDGGGGGQRFRARLRNGVALEREYPSFTLGEGLLIENYLDRFRAFIADCGKELTTVERIVMAVAALPGTNDERQELMRAIREATGADALWLTSDITAAHFATIKGDGLVVTIGTGIGAIATGKNRTQIHEISGDSFLIGDEASAYWTGKVGLNRALRYKDGRGPSTALLDEACRFFQTDPASLADYVTALERPVHRIAQFAPVVTRLAEGGDEVALSIIELAVDELEAITQAARKTLDAGDDFQIVFSGGAIPADGILFRLTKARLAGLGLNCDHSMARNIDGAFELAQEDNPGIYAAITDIA